MSLPTWIRSHLNTREPATRIPGERIDSWNIAHWTPAGLNILTGAHDRDIAQQRATEYDDTPGVFIVRGEQAIR